MDIDEDQLEVLGESCRIIEAAQPNLDLVGALLIDNQLKGTFGVAQVLNVRHDPTIIYNSTKDFRLHQDVIKIVITRSKKMREGHRGPADKAACSIPQQSACIDPKMQQNEGEDENSDDIFYEQSSQENKKVKQSLKKRIKKLKKKDERIEIKSRLQKFNKIMKDRQ